MNITSNKEEVGMAVGLGMTLVGIAHQDTNFLLIGMGTLLGAGIFRQIRLARNEIMGRIDNGVKTIMTDIEQRFDSSHPNPVRSRRTLTADFGGPSEG